VGYWGLAEEPISSLSTRQRKYSATDLPRISAMTLICCSSRVVTRKVIDFSRFMYPQK